MAFINVIGLCKRHDVIDAVPLFEQTLCVKTLFACTCICDRLDIFFSTNDRGMNINISNECILLRFMEL